MKFATHGGCYAIAKRHEVNTEPSVPRDVEDLLERYRSHCLEHGLVMEENPSVIPPDDTTLFTSSGMQKHKPRFKDKTLSGLVVADSQTCFRSQDLDEVGDGSHVLHFRMLGLFSFRSWTLIEGMRFWSTFLSRVGLEVDQVTVHPDKLGEHGALWERLGMGHLVTVDEGCTWSDGEIGGYCTEMHKKGLEVGNIVNPLGDCLDCGFGLERIALALGVHQVPPAEPCLRESCELLLSQGVAPGANGRGYVLRRMMRKLSSAGSDWTEPAFQSELRRMERTRARYGRLSKKHPGMDKSWWWSTHGVDLDEVEQGPSPGPGGL